MRLILVVLTVLTVVSTTLPSLSHAAPDAYAVVYRAAWVDGIDPSVQRQEPDTGAISVVSVAAFGGAALKTAMHRTDDFSGIANGAPRVELNFAPVFRFSPGNEYEMRWSTMIPRSYPLDALQSEIITQIHQSDSNIGSPPFALMLTGNQYQMDVRGDVTRQPAHSFLFGTPLSDEGHVVSWLLRYRPDDSGTTAVTELYKDGVLVVHAGAVPNAYPGDRNEYLKLGIYKWWWKTRLSEVSERAMYYGDIEVLGRPASADPMDAQP